MSGHERISVTKLAFYAEDPAAFSKAGGQPYNREAAMIGEKRHNAIGKLPSKALFIIATLAAIIAYLYLKS